MDVYVAGALFSDGDRERLERVEALCTLLNFTTFLPHRDSKEQAVPENATKLFEGNLSALEEARLVVAVLEGADVDAGTAWEIGYAFSRGKTIIGLRTDYRPSELGLPVNLMVAKSTYMTRSFDELRAALMAVSS